MQVIIPTADASNFGARITLLIDAHVGPCRIRAVTGTINDAQFTTLNATYSSLIELVSDGQGQWFTDRESGFPVAGSHVVYTGNTLDVDVSTNFTWTGNQVFSNVVRWNGIFTTTLAAQADNLAIGAVNVVRILLTGNQAITGMIPTSDDQLVFLENADNADTLTINHADAASTATSRFNCPNNVNFNMAPKSCTLVRKDASLDRWVFIGQPPGAGGGGLADGDYGDIVVSGAGTVLTVDEPVFARVRLLASMRA